MTAKTYDAVLFDLDGTLTDPFEGIANGYHYALGKYGIVETDYEKMRTYIGPPLTVIFSEVYGFSKEKTAEAVAFYREYYNEKGKYENKLYEGIEEVLKTVKSKGKKIYLATSKLTKFSEEILEYFGLNKYFDGIFGSLPDGVRDSKAEVIEAVLQENNLNKDNCIIIGDRIYDIEGAKKAGIDSCGVLYGYGKTAEFTDAEFVVNDMSELNNLLIKILNR